MQLLESFFIGAIVLLLEHRCSVLPLRYLSLYSTHASTLGVHSLVGEPQTRVNMLDVTHRVAVLDVRSTHSIHLLLHTRVQLFLRQRNTKKQPEYYYWHSLLQDKELLRTEAAVVTTVFVDFVILWSQTTCCPYDPYMIAVCSSCRKQNNTCVPLFPVQLWILPDSGRDLVMMNHTRFTFLHNYPVISR